MPASSPEFLGTDEFKGQNAERCSEQRPCQKRPKPAVLDVFAKMPDTRDMQRRCASGREHNILHGRQHMNPYDRRYDRKRKTSRR